MFGVVSDSESDEEPKEVDQSSLHARNKHSPKSVPGLQMTEEQSELPDGACDDVC